MKPSSLFGSGLTLAKHENNDLHYIGEALPAPSLVTSTLSLGSISYVGGSSVPAREDHVHAIDLTELINQINDDPELPPLIPGDVDLSDYYTKDEIVALLSNYYTSSQIDSILSNYVTLLELAGVLDNYYTKTQVDALLLGLTANWEQTWSYGPVVNPSTPVTLNRYIASHNLQIQNIIGTYISTSTQSTVIDFYVDDGLSGPSLFHTLTIPSSTLIEIDTGVNETISAGSQIYAIVDDVSTGDGEYLTLIASGVYVV